MSSPTTLISCSVPTLITVDEDFDAIPTKLSYDSADPFAVTLTSTSSNSEVQWVFARDLLRDGLAGQTGEGDVKIHPDAGAIVLELNSGDGSAKLECARRSIEGFVDDIYSAVPEGSECQSQCLDGWLAELVGN